MLQEVGTILEKECRLEAGRPLLVGVSGGPDSLCLADMLNRLGLTVIVAHFDHRLRPESADDAETVRQMAAGLQAAFVLGQADVGAYAADHHLSVEAAARELRYRFLFEQAEQSAAQAVAVAHTANDQVETVLMHLLRGAGLTGLSGMSFRSLPNAWSTRIPLLRPLLGAWREAITAYLEERRLQPLQDPTNTDTRFYRNRLRHELLPHLEALNPGVKQRLWQTANLLQADEAALDALVQAGWNACCREEGPGYFCLDAPVLLHQPLALQRRLLRRAIAGLRPGLGDIDFSAIQRALGFLVAPSHSRRLDLIAGLRLELEGERLWLAAWEADLPNAGWPQVPPDLALAMRVPGELDLPGGWHMRCELLPASAEVLRQALANPDPYQAFLDPELLARPLDVRARKPGQRFQPLGLNGHSLKLSDYMVNARLPRRARAGWPLLVCGEEVAWVPGLGIGQGFALREESRLAAHFKLET